MVLQLTPHSHRYLYRQLSSQISLSIVPPALIALRNAVFPDNALGPPRIIPDKDQQARLKTSAVDGILALIPPLVQKVYFGDEINARRTVEEMLDVFGDAYCTRHLIFGAIDLFVVRLMPEMAEKHAGELLGDKIG